MRRFWQVVGLLAVLGGIGWVLRPPISPTPSTDPPLCWETDRPVVACLEEALDAIPDEPDDPLEAVLPTP